MRRCGLGKQVYLSVKSGPIINDAMRDDALRAGIGEPVEVIETGSSSLGVVFEECSEEFREIFRSAGVVLSKGQANYETLDDAPRERLLHPARQVPHRRPADSACPPAPRCLPGTTQQSRRLMTISDMSSACSAPSANRSVAARTCCIAPKVSRPAGGRARIKASQPDVG